MQNFSQNGQLELNKKFDDSGILINVTSEKCAYDESCPILNGQREQTYNLERRQKVSFDAFYFEKRKSQDAHYTMREALEHIKDLNLWGAADSISGEGSTNRQTSTLKTELPLLFSDLSIQSILDAPCGDFGWLHESVSSPIHYTGIDILPPLIERHLTQYGESDFHTFICGDMSQDRLPEVDLILCRDCFVHFSFEDIAKTLKNFKKTNSRYLLTTNFSVQNQ